MNHLRNGKATRQIVGPDGTRRTVPAWQAQPTPRKGGLSDWLAARRLPPEQTHG